MYVTQAYKYIIHVYIYSLNLWESNRRDGPMGHNKTQMIIIKSLHNNLFSDHRHRLESTESGTVSFYNNYKHGYFYVLL